MKIRSAMIVIAITLAAGVAKAGERPQSTKDETRRGAAFSLAMTIGEVAYFIDSGAYRGPVSLEVVPSIGWSWVKLDLGLSTTLESIRIAGTSVGYWNFTFRPGARLVLPMIPLYLRAAIPLQLQRHDFDWGLLFGVGADIRLVGILGLVLEVDTTVSKNLEWGSRGIPLEFRAGVSLHF